ncbi:hypothetical protein FY050_16145 [Phyllobacterium endophyticum]|uniref:Uncharacterized protein n=1 Tax=Phyllobacterium endophyticum TaxID=1149773 RepID=A0A2P7B225_9HYPH|nr:hypothetical protein CU100_07615 [Phyllobacterium endophyticum]TYR42703.1 hypothetical protein FY050_16145 [Phyllobacterium endophyticum]
MLTYPYVRCAPVLENHYSGESWPEWHTLNLPRHLVELLISPNPVVSGAHIQRQRHTIRIS